MHPGAHNVCRWLGAKRDFDAACNQPDVDAPSLSGGAFSFPPFLSPSPSSFGSMLLAPDSSLPLPCSAEAVSFWPSASVVFCTAEWRQYVSWSGGYKLLMTVFLKVRNYYRVTKVVRDTVFVNVSMIIAPPALTSYSRRNSCFDVNIICVPNHFCHPVLDIGIALTGLVKFAFTI